MKPSEDPRKLANIRFSIGWSGIAAVVVVVAAWIYTDHPGWHPTMNFLGVAFAMVAAVLSAMYVGHGLKITVDQREEALRNDRIARAFVYVDAWDDPSRSATKQLVRSLVDDMVTNKSNPQKIKEQIDADKSLETAVLEVLNFLEGFCLASNRGVADDETLRLCFKYIVASDYSTFEALIKARRAEKNRPHLYSELEAVVTRWNANPIYPS